MAIDYHPKRGTLLVANFDEGFRKPEMVKKRLYVVISPPIQSRVGLCTIVPLSTTAPTAAQRFHYKFEIPFQLPAKWNQKELWAKCDMICAVGFHRLNLLLMAKDRIGKRQYQLSTLSKVHMEGIGNAVLAGIGLSALTKSEGGPIQTLWRRCICIRIKTPTGATSRRRESKCQTGAVKPLGVSRGAFAFFGASKAVVDWLDQ